MTYIIETDDEDPWGGLNPLGCCKYNVTKGGRPTHGGPDCRWPGPTSWPQPASEEPSSQ